MAIEVIFLMRGLSMERIFIPRKMFVIILFFNIFSIHAMNQIPAECTGSLADILLQFKPYQGKHASSSDISHQASAAKKLRISPINSAIQTDNQDQFLSIHPSSAIIAAELFPDIQCALDEELNDNFFNNNSNLFDCDDCTSNSASTQISISTSSPQSSVSNNISNESSSIEKICEKHPILNKDQDDSHLKNICNICNKQFARKSLLMRHAQSHTDERPFPCTFPGCSNRYKYKPDLNTHIRSHTNNKEFTCPSCDKSFSLKCNLITHIRIHTNERPFSCTFPGCTKKYKQGSDLKKHIRTHTDEKPYVCSICLQKFRQSSQRNSHVKKTHTNAEKMNFYCSLCKQGFIKQSSFTNHMSKKH
jgi:uncharacterized Zn-finger protein